jgi:hypothetical protein
MDAVHTAKLLTLASAVDNRIVDELTIGSWQDAIGHLEYDLCRSALARHRAESTEYLLPAHIAANVKRIIAERADEDRRSRGAIEPQQYAPRPDNEEAMVAAWNDPVAFAREVRPATHRCRILPGTHAQRRTSRRATACYVHREVPRSRHRLLHTSRRP